ncbi:response regulator [Niabella hirudinis]|uniref:response regulator n=1 Tax=Niabella hirudinis TaxID=1285929 RepID=UPI003EBF4342
MTEGLFAILVVDDEQDTLYLMTQILRQGGVTVIGAASIKDATAILKEHSEIKLIFLDNHLSDGCGCEFIGRFKTFVSAHIKVISAYATDCELNLANDNGADGFITKPFIKEQILEYIEVCDKAAIRLD